MGADAASESCPEGYGAFKQEYTHEMHYFKDI